MRIVHRVLFNLYSDMLDSLNDSPQAQGVRNKYSNKIKYHEGRMNHGNSSAKRRSAGRG